MRRRRRGAKRPTQWVCSTLGYGPPQTVVNGVVLRVMLVGTTGTTADFDPPLMNRYTVLRIRGHIDYTIGTGAAIINTRWRWGIIVTKTSGGGIAASLPDPASSVDGDSPWLWLASAFHGAAAANTGVTPNLVIEVDVKAKRVMRPDEALMLCSFQEQSFGAASMVNTPYLRTLISRSA